MHDAVAFFAIRMIAGIAAWCCLMSAPRHRVVSALFRIQMLLVLGLGVLAGLAGPGTSTPWAAAVCIPAFLGSALWLFEYRRAGRITFLIILGIAILWMAFPVPFVEPPSVAMRWLLAAGTLASAATLGATMCGMLLGHRYLTAPGMPLMPLHLANDAVACAAGLRLVVSLAALVVASDEVVQQTYVLWMALRWLAGIVGLVVVSFLVRRILIFRNTQAATGLLFVGVILAFIGELTGDLLLRATGVPF
jgi:hypothetical protein